MATAGRVQVARVHCRVFTSSTYPLRGVSIPFAAHTTSVRCVTWSQGGEIQPVSIPARRGARRRDRRGHGPRGPLLPPGMPGARTRSQRFEDAVLDVVEQLDRRWAKQLESVEFAVEDVPPSEPAPWEHGAPLGRAFAADAVAGLSARIVLYRRVIDSRCETGTDRAELVRAVVVEQVARLLDERPESIDPGYQAE